MLNIAIDGPAGAGKSTVAKAVAKRLGIIYLDTGAMYRTAALYALTTGTDPNDADRVKQILPDISVDVVLDDSMQRMLLNGKDVTDRIRTPELSKAASDISRVPEVRIKLVELQRKIAAQNSVVMDGRDIGTFVLPDAKYKFFLTASPQERARRRYLELKDKGLAQSQAEILKDIQQRDTQDSTREFAPLAQAADAVLVDSTALDAEQVAEYILGFIKENK